MHRYLFVERLVAVEVIKHRGAEDRRIMNWWNKALKL